MILKVSGRTIPKECHYDTKKLQLFICIDKFCVGSFTPAWSQIRDKHKIVVNCACSEIGEGQGYNKHLWETFGVAIFFGFLILFLLIFVENLDLSFCHSDLRG